MNYDVIVAGAGPGGATAARELVRRGLKVVLLEQKALPRYKPCGGCLSLVVLRKCCHVDDPHAPCLPHVAGTGARG